MILNTNNVNLSKYKIFSKVHNNIPKLNSRLSMKVDGNRIELEFIGYDMIPFNNIQLDVPILLIKARIISNLDKFLEAEKINNNSEPWCKLNKTIKVKKLVEYVDSYSNGNKLDTNECEILAVFLKDSLDKKKLSRVKDVIYDKTSGIIKDIPALVYNKSTKHFTLKNVFAKAISSNP